MIYGVKAPKKPFLFSFNIFLGFFYDDWQRVWWSEKLQSMTNARSCYFRMENNDCIEKMTGKSALQTGYFRPSPFFRVKISSILWERFLQRQVRNPRFILSLARSPEFSLSRSSSSPPGLAMTSQRITKVFNFNLKFSKVCSNSIRTLSVAKGCKNVIYGGVACLLKGKNDDGLRHWRRRNRKDGFCGPGLP